MLSRSASASAREKRVRKGGEQGVTVVMLRPSWG